MDRGRPRAPAHLEALRRAFIENAARRGPAPAPSLVTAPAATSSRAAAAGDESKNKVR